MRVLTLASGFVLVLAASCLAFGQAVAEGAMVHAGAATAGAKMGTALGNALSRATANNAAALNSATHSTGTAGQIQYVPQSPRTKGAPVSSGTASGPFVITSIQGSHQPCPTSVTAVATQANASAAPAPAQVTSPPAEGAATSPAATTPSTGCGAPAVQRESKSVINVTFK